MLMLGYNVIVNHHDNTVYVIVSGPLKCDFCGWFLSL